jgi:hypothetical protein
MKGGDESGQAHLLTFGKISSRRMRELGSGILVLLYLLRYSCFNNMYFVSGPSHVRQE